MRFIGGLGAGAVFPLPYLMLSEIAPAKHRGILVCICNAILTASYLLPTLCGSWAINNFSLDVAWRVPFIVGGLPIVTIYFLHRWLPESPRWLMRRGRHDEVRQLVERLEKSAGIEHDDTFINPDVLRSLEQAAAAERTRTGASWKALFRAPYLSRSLVSWSMYSAGLITWYVVMVYVPTILTTYGFQLSNSVILTGCMMVIGGAGSVVIGPLADKYGRKPIWSLYVIITIISLFLLTSTDSIPMLLFIGSFVAFFGTGIMPVCKVYIAEQYPTELRGVGTGLRRGRVPRGRRRARHLLSGVLPLRRRRQGRVHLHGRGFRHRHHRPVDMGAGNRPAQRRGHVRGTSKVTHAPRHLPLGAGTPTRQVLPCSIRCIPSPSHRPQPRCARGN